MVPYSNGQTILLLLNMNPKSLMNSELQFLGIKYHTTAKPIFLLEMHGQILYGTPHRSSKKKNGGSHPKPHRSSAFTTSKNSPSAPLLKSQSQRSSVNYCTHPLHCQKQNCIPTVNQEIVTWCFTLKTWDSRVYCKSGGIRGLTSSSKYHNRIHIPCSN